MKTITIELNDIEGLETLTINHNCFGEPISLESNLHITEDSDDYDADYRDNYNSAVDALESLVLEHACAGVNVSSDAYIKGTISALEAICNNIC